MRRNAGVHKQIVTMWIAVLTAVAMIAVTAAPVAAQEDPTGESLTATGLFKSLAEGAAGQVGQQFAGWALGAIGLGGSDTSGLEAIGGQLATISTELNTIIDELHDIESAIQVGNCLTELRSADNAVDAITTANSRYQTLVKTAAGVKDASDVDNLIPIVQQWTDDVLTASGGITMAMDAALNAIAQAMHGAAGEGILKECLVPSIVPLPTAGFGTDADYYGYNQSSDSSSQPLTVNAFIGYYYGYQALGLLMLQEAYHFQAQQAAGMSLTQVADIGALCTGNANYTPPLDTIFDCQSAEDMTNTVYQNLAVQFGQAGLPYTDDKVILRNEGDKPLFVRSLEDFTQAAGDDCPTPLTSADPCGVTVATGATAGDLMEIDYDGYTTWQTMNSGQVSNVVGNRGSLTPGQYMNSLGFENAEHKIILTSTTASFGESGTSGTLVCFLHTDLTGGQFCSNDAVFNRLLESEDCNPWRYYQTLSTLPTGNNNFFVAQTDCSKGWFQQPGWLLGNNAPNAEQYRWPLLMIGDLECTNGRTGFNTETVLSRCGADYDVLFNRMVPRPATCTGTKVGVCGDQVQVALSGPDWSGEWSSPVSGGDVGVTFDEETADRITGTVELPATDGEGSATVRFNIRRAGGKHGFLYNGTVKIRVDGQPVLVAPLQRVELDTHADGTVSGQLVWQRGRHGTYTLTWSVLDNPA